MAKKGTTRKLRAIFAADMVGYSRLMEADEEGVITRQKEHRKQLIDPTIADHNGRIVKTTGDGMLVEFASAVDAVNCAAQIQNAVVTREADVPEDRRIAYRVGINIGDIVIDGDDILGSGVNVAARLEALCEPGGVYVSGTVYDHIEGKVAASFDDLGEQTVKNITKPVRIYRVKDLVSESAEPRTPKLPRTGSDKPSIAVLPFDNLSGDPEQDYFADGMAEDLITDISKISGLFVIARNSSFAFKGQPVGVKTIAQQLGVKHILEGSVRKMGSKLRVNAQLIDAANGGHVWAERYDGDMAEIFEFQDKIREQIVSALHVRLTPTDKALAVRKPTDNVEAYDHFLRGRASFYRYTREDLLEAIKCFEEAIEIDPNFANAYSYLSYCYFHGWSQLLPGFDDNLDRANELAEKGVALDGTSAIALTRLGWIQTFLRHYDEAVANLEKAVALAPNNAEVYSAFGCALNYWGNPVRGLQMQEKAFTIDTVVPPSWEYHAGLSHLLLRQYDQALDRFNRVIERAPKFFPAYLHLACAYVELGQIDDARGAIKTLLEIIPQFTMKQAVRIFPYRIDEVHNRILDSLRKAGLPEG